MKLYIIGAAGSGKTTLAKRISNKTKIKCYHLDNIFYSDEKGNLRSEIERNSIFQSIIHKNKWIIEDNGSRECFADAMTSADRILILYPSQIVRTKRIITRYIRQKIGVEKAAYNPTFKLLKRMLNGSLRFESGDDGVINNIFLHSYKSVLLKTKKDINVFIDSLQL